MQTELGLGNLEVYEETSIFIRMEREKHRGKTYMSIFFSWNWFNVSNIIGFYL